MVGDHPHYVDGRYTPKKLRRRLNDHTGGIDWAKVPGKVYTNSKYTWRRPGSQNPRK